MWPGVIERPRHRGQVQGIGCILRSTVEQAAFSPRVGDRVAGRFELRAPICDDGAMRAFVAFDQRAGREVALVLFDPACAHSSAWAAFAKVVAAAAAAGAPGLVLPLELSPTPPEPPYCVFAPQVDRDLRRLYAQEGPLPWSRALTLGERILEVLVGAHAATNFAHRALTPSRCLVSANDEIQVLDFGVAELGGACGNAAGYQAPEQQHSPGDQRSDVYTVAAILFELVSGKCPSATMLPHLRLLVPVPFNVNLLLATALAQDPQHRYVDLVAMRAATREVLGLAPIIPAKPLRRQPASALAARARDVQSSDSSPRGHPGTRERAPLPASLASGSTPRPIAVAGAATRGLHDVPPPRQSSRAPLEPQPPAMQAHGQQSRPPERSKSAPIDPPTEPLMQIESVLPSKRSLAVKVSASAKPLDELPTMIRPSTSRVPRNASKRSVADSSGQALASIQPTADKTEAVLRPVLKALVVDKTEVLGCIPTAGKTEVLSQQLSSAPMELTTLVLSETEVAARGTTQIPKSEETSLSPMINDATDRSRAWSVQKRLIAVNLVFIAIILVGLFIEAILQ